VIFSEIPPGRNTPDEVNVVIEIPAHSDPVKYEVDKSTGHLVVDRFMSTAMHYPCNYGYIPQTLSEDGDPVDVLVVTPHPLISGCIIHCRPVGLLQMEDEKGIDNKLLAVPADPLSVQYRHVQSHLDLPDVLLKSISHFFEHYKDLEPGKWVKIKDWLGKEAVDKEIQDSIKRYQGSI
jgi:inorganic pyrophosphatase